MVNNLTEAQINEIVSKKIEKTAVGRNRIRRRVYEAIRQEREHFREPHDNIFVIYSKDILTMEFTELRALIRSLLEQSMI